MFIKAPAKWRNFALLVILRFEPSGKLRSGKYQRWELPDLNLVGSWGVGNTWGGNYQGGNYNILPYIFYIWDRNALLSNLVIFEIRQAEMIYIKISHV